MTWEQAVSAFERHLRSERGLSAHTLRAYASDLRQFQAFLQEGGQGAGPAGVAGDDVRAFLAARHGTTSAATLGRKLASLRTFFRFLVREGVRAADPSVGIPTPRAGTRLPAPLPVDDCQHLMEAGPDATDAASSPTRSPAP